MANKRMFRRDVLDTDAFLDMPLSTQALYFHLNLRADDDGFIGNPSRIAKFIGASEDDLKLLIAKNFVILFENGVIVVKHWRMHNTLSANRYHETNFTDEKALLRLKENNSYTLGDGSKIDDTKLIESGKRLSQKQIEERLTRQCQSNVKQLTNSDIDKDIDKDIDIDKEIDIEKKKPQKRFTPPTLEEVKAYCQERRNGIDPERFIDFYQSKGWKIGSNPMKDWKAAVRTWEKRDSKPQEAPKENSKLKALESYYMQEE